MDIAPDHPREQRHPSGAIDGVLVVDKAAGPTSHDVVARVRRLLHTRRVGHTGTLDPFATGVLPLVIGRATRLARFLTAGRKAYLATLRLGVATDTHDVQGSRVDSPRPGPIPAREVVDAALGRFRGAFEQVPPAFSAKKIQGTRAYALARRQHAVSLAPVPVHVSRLDVSELSGDRLVLSLECSSGFYVRALARDLGEALGCGAHLVALRRTRSGEFGERDAWALEALEACGDDPAARVVPLSGLVRWLPTARVLPAAVDRIRHGNPISAGGVEGWEPPAGDHLDWSAGVGPEAAPPGGWVRLVAPDGRLLGLARRLEDARTEAPILQPFVVLV